MGQLWVLQNGGWLPPPLPPPPPKKVELWNEKGSERKMDQGPHHTKGGEKKRVEQRRGERKGDRRGERKGKERRGGEVIDIIAWLGDGVFNPLTSAFFPDWSFTLRHHYSEVLTWNKRQRWEKNNVNQII